MLINHIVFCISISKSIRHQKVNYILTVKALISFIVLLSFSCALTPMLSPFDSVTVQTMVTGLMLIYAAIILTVVRP
jgi:formate hydrogenlyase subunit 4